MVPVDPHTFTLSAAESREFDRLALAEFGIPGVVLMENAGAGATAIALALLARSGRSQPDETRVVVAGGPGQNGGDGWVVARRLANAGCGVSVISSVALAALRGDSATHARTAVAMGIAHEILDSAETWARFERELACADLVVDALLGTGASGAPRGAVRQAIEAIVARSNAADPPLVLALDLPSGLDADTGARLGSCIRADATATFAARKPGLDARGALEFTGIVHVVDLGVPRVLYERVRGLRR